MTPPIFHLDDEVETANGTRFKISQIWKRTDGSFAYSDPNRRWFHADDLRLVPDELKIGDWVKVIGPDVALNDYYRGRRFRISQTPCQMSDMFSCEFYPNYFPAKSLRKLTPEEIEQHLQPKDEIAAKLKQFDGEIGHLFGSISECLIEAGDVEARTKCREMKINERLSAIEKRLSAIETLQFSQQDAIVHFENRLTFVEKFQRDQSDLVGRAIRDGVVEILDFRRKA